MSFNKHPHNYGVADGPRPIDEDYYWGPIQPAGPDRRKGKERKMSIDEAKELLEQRLTESLAEPEQRILNIIHTGVTNRNLMPVPGFLKLIYEFKKCETPKPPLSIPRTVWHRPDKTVCRSPKPPTR